VWGFPRFNPEQERWFDRWLKGDDNGVEAEPPVRIFVMGGGDGRRNAEERLDHGGRWRQEHEWPLARTQYTPYYLHHDGSLSPRLPVEEDASARYQFDPGHPVPTVGGTVTGFFEMVPMPHLDPFWVKYLPPRVRMRSIVRTGPWTRWSGRTWSALGRPGAGSPTARTCWRFRQRRWPTTSR